MKKKYVSKKVLHACLLFFMIIATNMFAQVGIGTTLPDESSVLDVTSTTQGMLTPRMTTAQRSAIVSPANGLIVYDTDLKSFFNYNTSISNWDRISSSANGRLNFKRIKSTDVLATVLAAEKAAGGGSKYLLNTNTLYEINGTVVADLPIELNNCYLTGLDSGEDKLVKLSGDLFVGTTGGSIRVLTLVSSAGKVFNITGTGVQNLIFRDCIVANSSNVGLLKGLSMVFISIVQYVGNSNGIVYEDINQLLISNAGWFGGGAPLANSGTYEKLNGQFGLVQKQGGFSEVTGASVGFDVSSNPVINGDAVMESVVFTGDLTTGSYVKSYTIGSFTDYNFNTNWSVRCAGIPTETDASASGNLYDPSNTTPTKTVATSKGVGYKVLTNNTTATNLLRFSSSTTGRLTYRGKKKRAFQVSTSIAFVDVTAGNPSNATYVFYIAKIGSNGTTVTALPETETYIDSNSGFTQAFPITGSVSLAKDESVEIWLKRLNDGTRINLNTYSFNVTAR